MESVSQEDLGPRSKFKPQSGLMDSSKFDFRRHKGISPFCIPLKPKPTQTLGFLEPVYTI